MDFDTAVKMNIYETIARTTQAPTSADVAEALSTSPEEVAAALERLHQKRLLVPEPGNPSRIRRCHTEFCVTIHSRKAWKLIWSDFNAFSLYDITQNWGPAALPVLI